MSTQYPELAQPGPNSQSDEPREQPPAPAPARRAGRPGRRPQQLLAQPAQSGATWRWHRRRRASGAVDGP